MFILITFLILVVTASTLLVLRIVVPGFRYHWPVAAGGALLAWVSAFIWLVRLPVGLQLPSWQPAAVFSQAPAIAADPISWAFAISLLTLCLAIVLTAVVRPEFPTPINWAGALILTSLGILAVVAGNPLALVMIWAAIDLAELAVQLWSVEGPRQSERVVVSFASRLMGILVLLWADMVGAAGGQLPDFGAVTPQAGLFLLIAAGLRLGVLPLHLPYTGESSIRRGFGTELRMVSAASSLILLARIPAGSLHSPLTPYLLMLASFAAIYGGWMWLRAPDELTARPFWLIGMGSLAVAAALRSSPVGAAAWSCALILAGSALFLFSGQNKWLKRALYAGAFGISSLPFSLTASGWVSGGTGFWLSFPFLLLSHAMMIAGYVRHSQRTAAPGVHENQPVWARNVYPIGIVLLLSITILLGLVGWPGALQAGNWFAGLIACLLAGGLLWLTPRARVLNPLRAHWVRPASQSWLDWAYQGFWGLFRRMGRLGNAFIGLLEGESGIMWTLLFLVLFMTVFMRGTR